MQNGTLLAAVDLGSNSFRLEIGRFEHGQIHRTEYLKETVRQGNGLDDARNLTGLQLSAVGHEMTLAVRTAWPQAYPQSAHLFREEVVAWQKTPWTLSLDTA